MSKKQSTVSRREFLSNVAIIGTSGLLNVVSSEPLKAEIAMPSKIFKPIKFGIISDIHRDLTPDADERLETFMKRVEEENPDFLISLGDFSHALPANEWFAKRFASSKAPAYHVLGNHEMDRVDKKEAVAFLNMPSPAYSFDTGGYHCVVLDPNYIYDSGKFIDYEKGNYFQFGGRVSYMDDNQCDWLESDLRKTNSPVFLFSHQSLLHDNGGIPNRAYVQRILERENERCGYQKILACFNGHHHLDFYRIMNGIHYISINSVSYLWHNERIPGRYPDELLNKYPALDNMAMYKDPLFCFVNINQSGRLSLRGVKSEWAVIPPDNHASKSVRYGGELSPLISDHDFVL